MEYLILRWCFPKPETPKEEIINDKLCMKLPLLGLNDNQIIAKGLLRKGVSLTGRIKKHDIL